MRNVLSAAFLLTIPLANWLIGHVGTVCIPRGPCLIPVAPGLMAPSGVLTIGAALLLRNLLQERAGRLWVSGCILIGAGLSALLAPPSIALASGVAFMASELADWSVYAPLRSSGRPRALIAAAMVGSVVDSGLFLWLAFGSLEFMAGQVVGKLWASLLVAAMLKEWSRFALAAAVIATIVMLGVAGMGV